MFCLKVVTFCKFALIELYIFPFVRRVGGNLFGELAKMLPLRTDDTVPIAIGTITIGNTDLTDLFRFFLFGLVQ